MNRVWKNNNGTIVHSLSPSLLIPFHICVPLAL